MKTYAIGDIHGSHRALLQCLERSGFNKAEDQLIFLGDVADGWSQVHECVEELLSIPNMISIKGNHDETFLTWLIKGSHPFDWLQGGEATLQSYVNHAGRDVGMQPDMGGWLTDLTSVDIDPKHIRFFKEQRLFYIDKRNNLYVHGGFDRTKPIDAQVHHVYFWDRNLWTAALSAHAGKNRLKMHDHFNEIFIGHTPTINWEEKGKPIDTPMHATNVWNLDTGAGYRGKLTIMDVDTHEYWQSDPVHELHKEEKGRNH